MGRHRSANSSGVGIVGRARSRQSEGTLLFPFDPEGTDVMVLEAKKLVLMSRSDHHVVSKVCRVLQAGRSSGFLSLTRASSVQSGRPRGWRRPKRMKRALIAARRRWKSG